MLKCISGRWNTGVCPFSPQKIIKITVKEFLKYESTETKRQVKDIIGNKRSQFLKLEERLKVAAHKACRDKHLWEPRRWRDKVL